MLEYEVVENGVEGFNPTAKVIQFKETVETLEHGEISEAVIVSAQGAFSGRRKAMYINDELYIEGLTEESLIWRLAHESESHEVVTQRVSE